MAVPRGLKDTHPCADRRTNTPCSFPEYLPWRGSYSHSSTWLHQALWDRGFLHRYFQFPDWENGWGSSWDKSCFSWTWKRPSISTLFSLRHCPSYQWLRSSQMFCIHSFLHLRFVHPEVTLPWIHTKKGFLPTPVPNLDSFSFFFQEAMQTTNQKSFFTSFFEKLWLS